MLHSRCRFINSWALESVKWSPVVGIFGLRQVGKTTLVKKLTTDKNGYYETFDKDAILEASRQTPELFCTRPGLLCLDEVQRAPWIFPVIKDIVGIKRQPGRFLLTGSVRFTLKKEISESLTGRIILHELLPFNLSEAHELKSSTVIQDLFNHVTRDETSTKLRKYFETKKPRITARQISHHMSTGGMPIPCFTRDEAKRDLWYQGYYETLIGRDLALVDTSLANMPYRQGISFLRQLARMQGQEVQYSALSSGSGLSLAKAKKVLQALLALSLIDLIPPEAAAQKAGKKMRIEWKDIGLWNYLAAVPRHLLEHDVTAMGVMIAQELRTQLSQINKMVLWSSYKNRDGAMIPWILCQGKTTLALTYVPTEAPRPYDYRALKQFVEKQEQGFGLVIGAEKAPILPLSEKIWLVPYTWLM